MQAKGGGGYIWGYYNRKPDIFLHEDGPITGEAYKRISKNGIPCFIHHRSWYKKELKNVSFVSFMPELGDPRWRASAGKEADVHRLANDGFEGGSVSTIYSEVSSGLIFSLFIFLSCSVLCLASNIFYLASCIFFISHLAFSISHLTLFIPHLVFLSCISHIAFLSRT